ncbi:MAG: 4Fe-4S binding protein [Planctomycetota bacterium]
MTAAPQTSAPDPLSSLPRQDRHKPKCGPVRRSTMGWKRAAVLAGIHVLIGLHIWHWLATGSSVTPVEPSEAMQTVELGKINAGFLLFAALIASTLVFGRWFCGWACHVVALQDLCAWLLGKLALRPRPVRSRLLVLAPWAVAGHMFAWPVIESWLGLRQLPPVSSWELHLTTSELWQTFPGPIMAVGTFVVVGFLIVWWLGAKGFCTHGCPYGAFFALADRVAPLRIKVTDACDACGHCTSVCTSNVRVHEEVAKHGQLVDPGCMKCLDCVSVCPKDALYVGLALPKPFAVSQQRITARADFTWPEELLLAVVALVSTQWVFRGAWFGEGVPFLLAVGLGVITAVFALLVVRLLSRRDVTFQHSVLKAGGKWMRAGRWGGLALVGWLLFAVHTFAVQRWSTMALEEARDPVRATIYESRPVSNEELAPVLASLDRYLGWAIVDDPRHVELRGLVLRGMGRHVDAEQVLLAALGERKALVFDEACLALASYDLDPARQRFAQARRLVDHVREVSPQHPIAQVLHQRLTTLGH